MDNARSFFAQVAGQVKFFHRTHDGNTVKALKRIEARADMGIGYNEYVLAVAS